MIQHINLGSSGAEAIYCREFEMENGQKLVTSITADGYIHVSVCDLSDYEKFLDEVLCCAVTFEVRALHSA